MAMRDVEILRIVYAFILNLILIYIFYSSYKKNKDIFSPMCIFSILQWCRYVPGILYYKTHMLVNLDDENLFITLIIEILFILSVFLGYSMKISERNYVYKVTHYKVKLKQVAYLSIILGLCSEFIFIFKSGGVKYILGNNNLDYHAGNGYLASLSRLTLIGMVMLLSLNIKRYKYVLLFVGGIYIFQYLVFLRRSPILECLLYLLFAYHYCVKKINIRKFFSLKVFFILFIIGIFIIVVPMFRTSENINFSNMLDNIFKEGSVFDKLFKQLSYVARDTFIYNNFNISNFYYGRTMINLLAAPIPSSIYNGKPPVDDGVYLYNFIKGVYILPPDSNYPFINSYPFSTQGSMYANWGLFGVLLGGFFLGLLYKKIYIKTLFNKDPFLSILYFTIIYQLELSSLSMVQTLVPICLAWVLFVCIAGRRVSVRS